MLKEENFLHKRKVIRVDGVYRVDGVGGVFGMFGVCCLKNKKLF